MTAGATDADRLARAALARVFEPGRADVFTVVRDRGAPALWNAVRAGRDVPGIGRQSFAGAVHRAQGYAPERDLEALVRLDARLVIPGDDEWPTSLTWPVPLLENAPPLALHLRGPARLAASTATSVAVVGARAASPYGVTVARELGFGLTEQGWSVVSGAAYGIDGAAHAGALDSGRVPTVAVLACGVDRAYPPGHDRLLARVRGAGLVVSEMPVGSAPTRSRFLVRNRLIAALSRGTVAVEAATRSGSLATLDRARTLGREAMAVPGPVTSAMSAGTNALLRNGVTCVTSTEDVIAQVGPMDAEAEPVAAGERRVRDELPETVRQVLDAVPVRRGAGPLSIARAAGVSPLVVQQVLPPLVLHGLVEQTADGFRLTALGAGRGPASRAAT